MGLYEITCVQRSAYVTDSVERSSKHHFSEVPPEQIFSVVQVVSHRFMELLIKDGRSIEMLLPWTLMLYF